MKRSLVAAGMAGLVTSLSVGIAGAHSVRFESTLTLEEREFVSPTRGTFAYRGKLRSEQDRCEPAREITLYRKTEATPAEAVGEAVTNDRGKYSIVLFANPPGKYFSVVSRSSYGGTGHEHVCKGDKSNVTQYTIGRAAGTQD
jgi:hypothetical protein